MEALATNITRKVSGARFRPEYSYSNLIDAVRRQGDIFSGMFNDDPEMDAECGLWCGEAP
jgi:hypothetical protein